MKGVKSRVLSFLLYAAILETQTISNGRLLTYLLTVCRCTQFDSVLVPERAASFSAFSGRQSFRTATSNVLNNSSVNSRQHPGFGASQSNLLTSSTSNDTAAAMKRDINAIYRWALQSTNQLINLSIKNWLIPGAGTAYSNYRSQQALSYSLHFYICNSNSRPSCSSSSSSM